MEQVLGKIKLENDFAIDKDDPTLIVATMYQVLLAYTQAKQEALLLEFHRLMTEPFENWSNEANKKADNLLNLSLNEIHDALLNEVKKIATEKCKVPDLLKTIDLLLKREQRSHRLFQIMDVCNDSTSTWLLMIVFLLLK